ncbi:MAG: AAA family ATPase [Candidatus Diapherotrites archaeon]|nr:AAA family ATPase [Candidatus Diapherotrites archaeon]
MNRDIMTPHYIPSKLLFRDIQIKEITTNLAPLFKGLRANNLFLYGKTGTGKTATAKFVLREFEEFASKNKTTNAKTIYINCRIHNSKYKVLLKILANLYPDKDFIGFSSTFLHEKLMEYLDENSMKLVLILDEIDKVKDVDELVYVLTRCNDDLANASITIVGISNNVFFKQRLDPRTRSSLCEKELVFPPYNANELKAILSERVSLAFKKGAVSKSAVALAAAIAAQESGDARTAVLLLLRAGEIADSLQKKRVEEVDVLRAKESVEEEIILSMINTLPEHEQLVLYAIASLTIAKKGIKKISGFSSNNTLSQLSDVVLISGEIYEEYLTIAEKLKGNAVSLRWFQQYINELEMHGLIAVAEAGRGFRGNTRIIKLAYDAEKIKNIIEKNFS